MRRLVLCTLLAAPRTYAAKSVDSECDVEIWFADSIMNAITGPPVTCEETGRDSWLKGSCADIVSTVSTEEGSEHQPPGWTSAQHSQDYSALDGPGKADYNAVIGELLYGTCTGSSACEALPVFPLASCFPASGSNNQFCTTSFIEQGPPYTSDKCGMGCVFSLQSYCQRGLSPNGQQVSGCTFNAADSDVSEAEQVRREKAWCSKVCTRADDDCGAFDTQGPCVADASTGSSYAARGDCHPWGWWVVGAVILVGALGACAALIYRSCHDKMVVQSVVVSQHQEPPPIIPMPHGAQPFNPTTLGGVVTESNPAQQQQQPQSMAPYGGGGGGSGVVMGKVVQPGVPAP